MTFFIIIAMIREIKGKAETLSIADLPVYLIYWKNHLTGNGGTSLGDVLPVACTGRRKGYEYTIYPGEGQISYKRKEYSGDSGMV